MRVHVTLLYLIMTKLSNFALPPLSLTLASFFLISLSCPSAWLNRVCLTHAHTHTQHTHTHTHNTHTHTHNTQQDSVAVWQTWFSQKVVTSAPGNLSPTHMPPTPKKSGDRNTSSSWFWRHSVLLAKLRNTHTHTHTHTCTHTLSQATVLSLLKLLFTLKPHLRGTDGLTHVTNAFVLVTLKVASKLVETEARNYIRKTCKLYTALTSH